jgi:hypothetical protein
MVLYADDTSIIISDSNPEFTSQANSLFHNINTWFKNNLLLLNLNKTQYLEFFTKHSITTTDLIQYNNNNLTTSTHVKFLGLIVDSTLSWNQHIDLVSKRLSTAGYAFNCLKHLLPRETLKIIYFAHVQSIISYGIIFWGSSPGTSKVFKLQKKILRIIYNMRPRDSCRELFNQKQIMTIFSLYLYLLTLFVVNNKHLFEHNNVIHEYNTRNNSDLNLPTIHLAKYGKGPFIAGIRVFKHLPKKFKALAKIPNKFKTSVKIFFHQHRFYSV